MSITGDVILKQNHEHSKMLWKIARWQTWWTVNLWSKKRIKEEDLIQFPDEYEPVDPVKAKAEFEDAIKLHKSKFWTKIKGRNLGEIKVLGDDGRSAKEIIDDLKKRGIVSSGLDDFIKKR